MMRAVRYTCLIFAVALLGSFCYSFFEREIYQTYDGWKFDHRPAPVEDPVVANHAKKTSAPAEGAIGRISIPRLHLSAMVREGVDDVTLQRAVGHVPASPLPGQRGNVALAGHRDTFFRGLKDLNPKDEIDFSTYHGDVQYRVESMMIVEPRNTSVLAADSGNTLTIVTCYPFEYIGNAPKRFVVRAKQIQ